MKTKNRMRRICLLILFLVATAMNVSAAKYDLWIADVQVTDANKDDLSVINGVSGTVKYNPSTKTLTLDNATMTRDIVSSIKSEIDGLTINVSGTNSISSNAKGCSIIYASSDLIINGSGTLSINGSNFESFACGIYLDNCNLTVSGCALTVTEMAAIYFFGDNHYKMSVTNDAHLDLKGYECIVGNYIAEEQSGNVTLEVLGEQTFIEANNINLPSGRTSPCFEGIYQFIFGDGIDIFEPAEPSHLFQGKLVTVDGVYCTSVKIGDLTPPVRRIDITDYTWPTDFEPADYEVTSPTEGVKSISVSYRMIYKSMDPYEGYTGDYLGIRFTVELENGYKFADDVNAYMVQDGSTVTQYSIEDGATASKKSFVFTYRVPTPEGGVYMRTAKDSITAPVIGAEPVWEITAAAGAKPAGILPETNPKEQFQRDYYCPVNEINWWEYAGEEGWKLMERGDVFKAGKKYFVEMLASSVSGQQFHDRTVYEVNGKVAKAIDNTPPVKIPTEEGAYYIRVAPTETKMCYVFRQLPFRLSDVNRDGSISMADANMVVNYFLTTEKPTGFPVHLANVNGDTDDDGNPAITMADANAIVNMFLGQ